MNQPRLHVIIDVSPRSADPVEMAALVIRGGAPLIQLRPKGVTDAVAYDVACRVADLCCDADVRLVVNDRTDLALAVRAAGVHLGAEDLPIAVVRQILGAEALVGGTARNAVTARALQSDGASYIGVGPIYQTASKIGLPDPLGLAAIVSVSGAVTIPVIAISGITVDRVAGAIAAGAYGVAVIGAISRADDPTAATAAFVRSIEQAVTHS